MNRGHHQLWSLLIDDEVQDLSDNNKYVGSSLDRIGTSRKSQVLRPSSPRHDLRDHGFLLDYRHKPNGTTDSGSTVRIALTDQEEEEEEDEEDKESSSDVVIVHSFPNGMPESFEKSQYLPRTASFNGSNNGSNKHELEIVTVESSEFGSFDARDCHNTQALTPRRFHEFGSHMNTEDYVSSSSPYSSASGGGDLTCGNGSNSTSPWFPILDQDEREWRSIPSLQHTSISRGSSSKYYVSALFKRSILPFVGKRRNDSSRGEVYVNGHLIPESVVINAEAKAGNIHPGSYWYDYQAGFWGVMGGPCQGLIMPHIEEFMLPMEKGCASGQTGICVNDRELHEKDLEILAKRGLPRTSGMSYGVDMQGNVWDKASGHHLKNLGKLAPTIEKRGRGFGMFSSNWQL